MRSPPPTSSTTRASCTSRSRARARTTSAGASSRRSAPRRSAGTTRSSRARSRRRRRGRRRPRSCPSSTRSGGCARPMTCPGRSPSPSSSPRARRPATRPRSSSSRSSTSRPATSPLASEAIGRQLVLTDEPARKAALWRRRARLYRDTLERDAEAYRCLKEAHACAPANPEIAYQLRTAAMVRGEWALAASLLYREIAAAATPRERGALHLELALIFDERLDDDAQAQVNFEQALAFDPTIPAAKLPLARRYEAIGRHAEAARLYDDAASSARAADRGALLEAANRCRSAATSEVAAPDLVAQLEHAESTGEPRGRARPRPPALARRPRAMPSRSACSPTIYRAAGDLAALTDLTSVRASRAETPSERAAAWLEVARLAEDARHARSGRARVRPRAGRGSDPHRGARRARRARVQARRLRDRRPDLSSDLVPGDSVLGADELALRRSIIAEHLGRDAEALAHAQLAAEAAPTRRDVMMRVQELATRVGELDIGRWPPRARCSTWSRSMTRRPSSRRTSCSSTSCARPDSSTRPIYQLDRVLRDHPMHAPALEALADLHIKRGDWPTATRLPLPARPARPVPGAARRAAVPARRGRARPPRRCRSRR